MKVKIIKTIKEFELLKDSWNDLVNKSGNILVHLKHEWFYAWWMSFKNHKQSLHVLTVIDDNGDIIAIAPLMQFKCLRLGIPVRKICFLANGHSPSADFIIRKDKTAEGIQSIFHHLKVNSDWDIIELQKLNSKGNTFLFIMNYLKQSGDLFGVKDTIETPFIKIDSDWNTFLHTRSQRFRKALRNKINRAKKIPDSSVEKIQITGSNHPALQDMFSVSGRSWKKKVHSDLQSNVCSKNFYMHISDQFGPQGIATLWFFKILNKPIAFEYHLSYNNVIYPLRADFDESFRYLSPGSVLEYNILKNLFDNPNTFKEYDTCGDTYRYLLNWTENTRKYLKIEIYSGNFRSHILHALKYKLLPILRKLRVIPLNFH